MTGARFVSWLVTGMSFTKNLSYACMNLRSQCNRDVKTCTTETSKHASNATDTSLIEDMSIDFGFHNSSVPRTLGC